MYAYFNGTIEDIDYEKSQIVIDVNDIGYNITIPIKESIILGEKVKVYTYTMVREDTFSLYGFLTKHELNVFKQLITVSGVGPKAGIAILGTLSCDELAYAIDNGDSKVLSKAPGVGKKMADRIILELKNKIEYDIESNIIKEDCIKANDILINDYELEALDALIALGINMKDAKTAIQSVYKNYDMNSIKDSNSLLKKALLYL